MPKSPVFQGLKFQKNSGMVWRSRRRKSTSVPEGGADFPAAIFLAVSAQTLAGIAFRAARKSGKNFPAASNPEGPEIEKLHARSNACKTIPTRIKEPFSLEFFILGLKFSFSLEISIPGFVFLWSERGSE